MALKLLCVLALVALANSQPTKRFAGFGLAGLSTIGGNVGCVVTGNRLYVNGLDGRELSVDEQSELREYEQKLAAVRDEIKKLAEERRAAAEERRRGGESASPSASAAAALAAKAPQAPKKPSFCSEQATTQYIFDGCKVQNNAVYVGSTFARKLDEQEIAELKDFDQKMSVYQKSVSSNLEEQLNTLFSGAFSGRAQIQRTSTEKPTTTETPVEPPKTPNFCTMIV